MHYSTIWRYNKAMIGSREGHGMKPNEKHFSLRIDSELLRKFDAVAKYDDRSMNWLLLRLIRQCVEEFEKENGKIKFDD